MSRTTSKHEGQHADHPMAMPLAVPWRPPARVRACGLLRAAAAAAGRQETPAPAYAVGDSDPSAGCGRPRPGASLTYSRLRGTFCRALPTLSSLSQVGWEPRGCEGGSAAPSRPCSYLRLPPPSPSPLPAPASPPLAAILIGIALSPTPISPPPPQSPGDTGHECTVMCVIIVSIFVCCGTANVAVVWRGSGWRPHKDRANTVPGTSSIGHARPADAHGSTDHVRRIDGSPVAKMAIITMSIETSCQQGRRPCRKDSRARHEQILLRSVRPRCRCRRSRHLVNKDDGRVSKDKWARHEQILLRSVRRCCRCAVDVPAETSSEQHAWSATASSNCPRRLPPNPPISQGPANMCEPQERSYQQGRLGATRANEV